MVLSIGQSLPEATFTIMGRNGPEPLLLSDFTKDRRVVLFGVPGAFTPTCHGKHLPGYLDNIEIFKQKGIDEIAVISANDVFVLHNWAIATRAEGKIRFLSDGNAAFARAAGLELDMSDLGMGMRSKRYSMLIDNGKLTLLNIEETTKSTEKSGAAHILAAL